MKKVIYILFIVLAVSCKTKKAATPKLVKVAPTEVSADKKKRIYTLSKRVLSSCNTSKFKPYNETEATAEVIGNITPEKISVICKKFMFKYGKFEDINLVEVIKDKATNTDVFRYKAIYERKQITKELRISVNADNKISEIKSTDWVNNYIQ
jgi:hypothetical protein